MRFSFIIRFSTPMVYRAVVTGPLWLLIALVAFAGSPCPLFFTLSVALFVTSTLLFFLSKDYRRSLELSCAIKRGGWWVIPLRKRIFNLLSSAVTAFLLVPFALELSKNSELGYFFFLLLLLETIFFYLFKGLFSKLLRRGWDFLEASETALFLSLPLTLSVYILSHFFFLPISEPLKAVDLHSLKELSERIFSQYKCPPAAGYIYLSETLDRLVWGLALAAASYVQSATFKALIFSYLVLKNALFLTVGGKLWSETLKAMEIVKNLAE